MKRKVLARLNLAWVVVFLVFFGIILFSVNPFEASIFLLILFYIVFFGLILGILNLIGARLNIPFWVILLISIAITFLLIFQSFKF